MIDRAALKEFIETKLSETGRFLVDLTVSPDNVINVEIDTIEGSVDIDECVMLSRAIEERFPRDDEDYELELGSAGLTSPFKVKGQYLKNIGNEVEVLAGDGKKYKGILQEAGDDTFTIVSEEKVKHEGAKRPVTENVTRTFPYAEVKRVNYLLKF